MRAWLGHWVHSFMRRRFRSRQPSHCCPAAAPAAHAWRGRDARYSSLCISCSRLTARANANRSSAPPRRRAAAAASEGVAATWCRPTGGQQRRSVVRCLRPHQEQPADHNKQATMQLTGATPP